MENKKKDIALVTNKLHYYQNKNEEYQGRIQMTGIHSAFEQRGSECVPKFKTTRLKLNKTAQNKR